MADRRSGKWDRRARKRGACDPCGYDHECSVSCRPERRKDHAMRERWRVLHQDAYNASPYAGLDTSKGIRVGLRTMYRVLKGEEPKT